MIQEHDAIFFGFNCAFKFSWYPTLLEAFNAGHYQIKLEWLLIKAQLFLYILG
jgi:hypothetical protein